MAERYSPQPLMYVIILIIGFVGNLPFLTAAEDRPIVQTEFGRVRGIIQYAVNSTKPVYTFLGVPFAKSERFRPSYSPQPWTDVRDVDKIALPCPQNMMATWRAFWPSPPPHNDTHEDCLNLDIYSPDTRANLPVLVWIYGGSLNKGMSGFYDGTAYATFEDVVIVVLNYRVGVLGFLRTEDGEIPGNLGLRDQVSGLEWVQRNIRQFGGDPNRVTLFGQSAGGLSTTFHLVSPLSRGLFHSVVIQSGSGLLPHIIRGDSHVAASKSFAEKLGCESVDLIKCAQGHSAEDIVNAQTATEMEGYIFHGTIDGTFLQQHPRILYEEGRFLKLPMLLGFTSHEGFLFLWKLASAEVKGYAEFRINLIHVLKFFFPDYVDEVAARTEEFFLTEERDSETLQMKLTQITGELLFIAPTVKLAQLHSKAADTYLYRFSHRPSFSPHPSWLTGANHGQELFFAWGDALLDRKVKKRVSVTGEEGDLSRNWMRLIANFAKFGDPNLNPYNSSFPSWPKYDRSQRFLDFSLDPTIKHAFEEEHMHFWNDVIDSLTQRDWRRFSEAEQKLEL